MMNIESKKWKIKATGFGYSITNKSTGDTRLVPNTPDFPSENAIVYANENEFDKMMEEQFNKGR